MAIWRVRLASTPVVGKEIEGATAVQRAVHTAFAAGCVAVDPAAFAPIELSQFQPANVKPVFVSPVPVAMVVVLPWFRPVTVEGVVPVPPPRLYDS
jgi:hypothetical protein